MEACQQHWSSSAVREQCPRKLWLSHARAASVRFMDGDRWITRKVLGMGHIADAERAAAPNTPRSRRKAGGGSDTGGNQGWQLGEGGAEEGHEAGNQAAREVHGRHETGTRKKHCRNICVKKPGSGRGPGPRKHSKKQAFIATAGRLPGGNRFLQYTPTPALTS